MQIDFLGRAEGASGGGRELPAEGARGAPPPFLMMKYCTRGLILNDNVFLGRAGVPTFSATFYSELRICTVTIIFFNVIFSIFFRLVF